MEVIGSSGKVSVGIMQPYFLPYVGYFQLIAAVDKFVIYDNIKYTKKGWINRNRILVNGRDKNISLALKDDSNTLSIRDRYLSPSFSRINLLNQVRGAYSTAPNFPIVYDLVEKIMHFNGDNLFKFIHNSLLVICDHLEIQTEILVSSEIESNPNLHGRDRVISLSKDCEAGIYVNPISGQSLYDRSYFESNDMELRFFEPYLWSYKQFHNPFIAGLSILDVLMFNSKEFIIHNLRLGRDF